MPRIVAISDTHLVHDEYDKIPIIPDGDVIICSGDITFRGRPHEIYRFAKWFHSLPHKNKVLIAGNHDLMFEDDPDRAIGLLQGQDPDYWDKPLPNGVCTYLRDSEVTIDGIRIYGAPWSPRFYDWAFNVDRGAAIKAKWDLIPNGIDVLVTHGPPYGYGDMCRDGNVGCEELKLAVDRVKPKIHIFGHIHPGYGVYKDNGVTYINASMCDETYYPAHPPIVIDL